MRTVGYPRQIWSLAVVCASLFILNGRAEAQFGYGYGGFGFNFQPPEIGFINSNSLQNASKASMGPVQNNAYANNPNAYINHLHDDGYLDKYDVGSRRTIEASIGRFSDGPPPSRSQPRESPGRAAPPAAPSLPLTTFFDRYQKLVWPESAPVFGAMGATRLASDLACLGVLNEYNLRGLAQVSTVTDARAKLIDYGQPALQYIRVNSTPRIADGFHLFLLSLYDSLAQAATIPKPVTPVVPPQP